MFVKNKAKIIVITKQVKIKMDDVESTRMLDGVGARDGAGGGRCEDRD